MAESGVDCTVLFGADHVNHMGGYWRYFGGPSGLVVAADGERTLVVMRDEVPVAAELGQADDEIGYGERGFGLDLDPVAGLIRPSLTFRPSRQPAVSVSRRRSPAPPPGLLRSSRPSWSSVRGHVEDPAAQGLGRAGADPGRVRAVLARAGGGREAAVPGVSEIELFSIAQSTAQVASGRTDRVRLRSPLGAELRRGVLPVVSPGRAPPRKATR